MKHVVETISLRTQQRNEMVDVTREIRSVVGKAGIENGDVLIYCPHTTGGITINENADPSVIHDILLTLEELIPENRTGYRHGEGNSDSHTKSSLVGISEQIILRDGQMVLGTWQGIYFCEFDGPRNRTLYIQIRGE